MPPKRKRGVRNKKSRHIIFIIFLIVVGIFLYFEEFEKEKTPVVFKPDKPSPVTRPDVPSERSYLPKVAIVMDDMGDSREKANAVFNLDQSVTIAIIPHLKYSAWTAEEGNRRGHDILLHIPMEAISPLKLGEGGLYTWMSDEEISSTLSKGISSVPHLKGASSHMGSALTTDERAMNVVVSELKKHQFFFLDSLTTPKSVAYKLAKAGGLQALRRDVFLDDKDGPAEIEIQWKRLLKIAETKGQAIAQGHPRKNTLEFLEKALRNNSDVNIVPITELLPPE